MIAPGSHSRRRASRKRKKAEESTLAVVDRLLMQPHSITLNGEVRQVPTIEAIILQLLQKAIAGSGRAWRALLKYQDFADRRIERKLKVQYVDSEYTRAFKKAGRGKVNG